MGRINGEYFMKIVIRRVIKAAWKPQIRSHQFIQHHKMWKIEARREFLFHFPVFVSFLPIALT